MYIPDIELQSPAAIRQFQAKALQHQLGYLRQFSPFYREWFARHQLDTDSIREVDDLRKIPPVGKEELQQRNWDFLCVDKSRIAEYTSTSGTLGKPVIIPLTGKDLDRLTYNEFISFSCAGGTDEDIYQLMLTLDRQFMAGMAYYSGIRKLGAGVLRVGPGVPSMQWENIARIRPTTIVAVPSFILKLIAFAEEHGIDINASSVKKSRLHRRKHPEYRLQLQRARQKDHGQMEYSVVFHLCFHRNADRLYGMQSGQGRASSP